MVIFTNYLRSAVRWQSLKQLVVTMLLLLSTGSTFADKFEIDGFTYETLSDNTVELVSGTDASGDVVIPSTVTYNESSYTVTSIGNGAFLYCTSMTSIDIPDGVTSIGEHAFAWCSGLTSINIPDGVTSIGKNAFADCTSLTEINIPNGVTSIERSVFSGCSGLTSINIPDAVTSIGNSAFYGCSSLTSIDIPDEVTSIGQSAFEECSGLTSISIGNGVTSIGEYAFQNCSNLTEITCQATRPPYCDEGVFYYVETSECTLYVPDASIEEYKSSYPWSEFSNIKGISATGIDGVKVDRDKAAVIYDLNGRKLSEPMHGLNIINGKKVVVK